MNSADVRLSKYLSRILRHAPESAGLTLDREGWAELDAVVAAAAARGLAGSAEDVGRVVEHNNKRRFGLSPDGKRIRAVQGHSSPLVELTLNAARPPDLLFHGTADRNLPSIMAEGLYSGRRHHVHLSADMETALQVGRRHGVPAVLEVAAAAMARDGHQFFRAENGVWLVRAVPPEYVRGT
ncbi:MAG: RNA:NAD 2'-phosphotransferase [uncultured Sphingomonas sp.]|uniref:Probable RNA 2'-phosphotransferase n=1 Tax=uncultured Sphingomonas sp. TaxID=158754 RepID=A0A6J4T8U5_9SPHN|nr:RNA 2'-phosphotransferase [uncultured Sphingomonas sp.]CAA9516286.1 MAG: RNA:NAD 2'-phosphotransferase [uncultured Sphingomonas sp.]